jgi:hypothetical protein
MYGSSGFKSFAKKENLHTFILHDSMAEDGSIALKKYG